MISQQALGPFLFGFNYVVPQFWMIALHRSGALAHDRYVLFRLCMTDMLDRQIHFVCVWQIHIYFYVHNWNALFVCMTGMHICVCAWEECTVYVHDRCVCMTDMHLFCVHDRFALLCTWQMRTNFGHGRCTLFLYMTDAYFLVCMTDAHVFACMTDAHFFVYMTDIHFF